MENEVEGFEAIGSDPASLEQIASTTGRLDSLETGVRNILDQVCELSLDVNLVHSPELSQSSTPDLSDVLSSLSAHSSGSPSLEPPAKVLTNRERLELVQELQKQPFKTEDIWFMIPPSWFSGWERLCEQRPNDIDTGYRCIDGSYVSDVIICPSMTAHPVPRHWMVSGQPSGHLIISSAVWHHLSNW